MSIAQHPASSKEALAQLGWYLDSDWAQTFDCEVDTLRKNLKKFGVPMSEFGNPKVIHIDDVASYLQKSRNNGQKEK